MEGYTIGVFGTEQPVKTAIESWLAKKSEAEGIESITNRIGQESHSSRRRAIPSKNPGVRKDCLNR